MEYGEVSLTSVRPEVNSRALQQLGVVPPPGAAQFSRQLPVD
jgi:hypothetical protein